jgi:putative addiction module component (TIGR02574 family)
MDEQLPNRHEMWESSTAEDELAPLTKAQQEEIDRRLAAFEADPTTSIPWEQVKRDALARLRRLRNKGSTSDA